MKKKISILKILRIKLKLQLKIKKNLFFGLDLGIKDLNISMMGNISSFYSSISSNSSYWLGLSYQNLNFIDKDKINNNVDMFFLNFMILDLINISDIAFYLSAYIDIGFYKNEVKPLNNSKKTYGIGIRPKFDLNIEVLPNTLIGLGTSLIFLVKSGLYFPKISVSSKFIF
jgi:hypothetical protein